MENTETQQAQYVRRFQAKSRASNTVQVQFLRNVKFAKLTFTNRSEVTVALICYS